LQVAQGVFDDGDATATTMKPWSMRFLMASNSTIFSGIGEAIIRRQPRPASSLTIQPSWAKTSALSLVVKPPHINVAVGRPRVQVEGIALGQRHAALIGNPTCIFLVDLRAFVDVGVWTISPHAFA
jgi:hypothetical protein